MARLPLEAELERLGELRSHPDDAHLRDRLRAAIAERRPLIAAKGARIAAERGLDALVPDLEAALGRLLGGPEAEPPDDPGCLGKTALARALLDLEARSPDLFLRAVRHVQLEPAWDGAHDAAAELRAVAALGLAASGDPRALPELADLLADPEAAARSGAARALAAAGRPGCELLLRFKARLGDDDAGVLLDVYAALLAVAPRGGIGPVAHGLAARDELRLEAAAVALGTSRLAAALEPLVAVEESEILPERRGVLLRAIALLRTDEATDHLLRRVATAGPATARLAVEALRDLAPTSPRLRRRLGRVVEERGDGELQRAFEEIAERGEN